MVLKRFLNKNFAFLAIGLALSLWVGSAPFLNLIALYKEHWMVTLTMFFGAFIAGASSEGGGAVAFPVFTLLLDIVPSSARNFSLAIQSVGMSAASLIILQQKIPIIKKVLIPVSFGGALGIVLGTIFLMESFSPKLVKLIFVSVWLSFGTVLYKMNKRNEDYTDTLVLVSSKEVLFLVITGFLGGCITSMFGNGIDILTFSVLVLYFKISEKVATPTSVIVMTINTILGFMLHWVFIKDITARTFEMWLVSIPVVLILAPIGSLVINLLNRESVSRLLIAIIFIQYIGALIILSPSLVWVLTSFLLVALGAFGFNKIYVLGNTRIWD
jgi:uncharacterized membrane protein YfcA